MLKNQILPLESPAGGTTSRMLALAVKTTVQMLYNLGPGVSAASIDGAALLVRHERLHRSAVGRTVQIVPALQRGLGAGPELVPALVAAIAGRSVVRLRMHPVHAGVDVEHNAWLGGG